MSLRKTEVTFVVVLALVAIGAMASGPLSNLNKFENDGVGSLVLPDTATQTAALQGDAGYNASISFTAANQTTPPVTGPNFVCLFKAGSAKITSDDGTITMAIAGSGCANVANQESIQFSYVVTGGTNKFAGAKGTGSLTWGITNAGVAGSPYLIHIDGNIQTPNRR